MLWGWEQEQYDYARKWVLKKHGLVISDWREIQDAWDIENIFPPKIIGDSLYMNTRCDHRGFKELNKTPSTSATLWWCPRCGAIQGLRGGWKIPKWSSNLSAFIRLANPEEKNRVYMEVIDKATKRQSAKLIMPKSPISSRETA